MTKILAPNFSSNSTRYLSSFERGKFNLSMTFSSPFSKNSLILEILKSWTSLIEFLRDYSITLNKV